jgi:hypothetical protein
VACYSLGMELTTAPDLTPGYPSKGARLGPAWAAVWAELRKSPGEWRDGHALWMDVAPRFQLSTETLRALMFRMATEAGHLESESRQVQTARGKRNHTHFRIKVQED